MRTDATIRLSPPGVASPASQRDAGTPLGSTGKVAPSVSSSSPDGDSVELRGVPVSDPAPIGAREADRSILPRGRVDLVRGGQGREADRVIEDARALVTIVAALAGVCLVAVTVTALIAMAARA